MHFKELANNLEMEEEEFLEMMEVFLETSSSDLKKLQSSMDEGDMRNAANAAHSIKGAALSLGLMDIYEMAKKMEGEVRENHLGGATEHVNTLKEKLDRIEETIHKERAKG